MAKPVALQLYAVRKMCEQGFSATLRQVAEIGFPGVEMAGLHGMKVGEVSKMLADLGLKVAASHVEMPNRQNLSRLVEQEQALGNSTLVSGFRPADLDTEEKAAASAALAQEAVGLLKPHGMRLALHNHWWEFTQQIAGGPVYHLLLKRAPDVLCEVDFYWAAYGHADPAQVVWANRARTPLLHVKDGTLEPNAPHTAVGSGVLDIPGIIESADPDVLEWLVVELDECATDMMEALAQSYRYLTQTGLGSGRK